MSTVLSTPWLPEGIVILALGLLVWFSVRIAKDKWHLPWEEPFA